MDEDATFQVLKRLVEALGQVFGSTTELVLHDIRHPESSIIAIINGHVTGRKLGDSSTNLVWPILRDPYGEHDAFNYKSLSKSGRVLRSSSIYFKNRDGRIFGSLCINQDFTDIRSAAMLLQDMCATTADIRETFSMGIDEVLDQFIEEALHLIPKSPDAMSKEEKLVIIHFLEDKGAFSVKRSVEKVASVLGVSRMTVYAYLGELQRAADSPVR